MSKSSTAATILSLVLGVLYGTAAFAGPNSVLSETYTCGNGTAKFVTRQSKLVTLVATPAGQGYNTAQAGIFINGITGGVTTTVGISYKVKPLNGSTIGCLQGPLLRDVGTASAYGAFSAINSPGIFSTVTGPDANGYYTVTFTNGPGSFNSPSITFTTLGLVATNGGEFLISDFKIGNNVVPLSLNTNLKHPCALGQLSDATFSTYCGGP